MLQAYIIGNPPFVSHQWRTPTQVEDMTFAFPNYNKHGKLDYLSAWYSKAADFIHGTKIACAFLSTNSIVQGESVRAMWEYLFSKPNKKIFYGETCTIATNINAYLLDAPNLFIENRGKPLHGLPKMTQGNQPTDGGNLILSPSERA